MRSALFNAAVVCVVSAYFVFFTIKFLNARPLFAAIAPAYDYEQGVLRAESIEKKEESSANEVQTPQALFTSRPKVEELVSFWVNLSPAPYLGENLTLAKVSSQIGVSQRLLSDYLNNTLNLNFNAWINTLRIGEVKRFLSMKSRLRFWMSLSVQDLQTSPRCPKCSRKLPANRLQSFR